METLNLDGKEHKIADLTEEQKMLVNLIVEKNNIKSKLNREIQEVTVLFNFYSNKLKQLLEKNKENKENDEEKVDLSY